MDWPGLQFINSLKMIFRGCVALLIIAISSSLAFEILPSFMMFFNLMLYSLSLVLFRSVSADDAGVLSKAKAL